jgi:hemerythrin superfamily protein
MSATTKSPTKSKTFDAIELLTADHKSVKAMFQAFEKLKERDDADDEKADLVQRICAELSVHATIEEEIFYPAVREAIDEDDLMDEADVEHASAKDLIAELEVASPGDDHFDAKVTVLGELIEHHVKEEEGEMFPKAKKAINVDAVGAELAERKAELSDEMADSEEPVDDATRQSQPGREARTKRPS